MRTDAELIRAARDRCRRRSASCTTATPTQVHGYHLRRTRDPHAAHDLTAETFAQAWLARRRSATRRRLGRAVALRDREEPARAVGPPAADRAAGVRADRAARAARRAACDGRAGRGLARRARRGAGGAARRASATRWSCACRRPAVRRGRGRSRHLRRRGARACRARARPPQATAHPRRTGGSVMEQTETLDRLGDALEAAAQRERRDADAAAATARSRPRSQPRCSCRQRRSRARSFISNGDVARACPRARSRSPAPSRPAPR